MVVPVLACELAVVINGYYVVGKGFSQQHLQCGGRATVMFLEPQLSPSKTVFNSLPCALCMIFYERSRIFLFRSTSSSIINLVFRNMGSLHNTLLRLDESTTVSSLFANFFFSSSLLSSDLFYDPLPSSSQIPFPDRRLLITWQIE